MLSTAVIYIIDDKGCEHSCRILLDNGSQPNIITENLATRLNLKKKKLNLSIEVVNNLEMGCRGKIEKRDFD